MTAAAVSLAPEILDDARIAVSELVTNACRHSLSARPGGELVLDVDLDGCGGISITVTDQGSAAGRRPAVNAPGVAEGGMGLGICRSLGELDISGGPSSGWCVRLTLQAPMP